jgi:hypothetical protein
MWIFSQYGFFSFVCPRKPDGKIDSKKVVIRARSESHLQDLQSRFPELADRRIITTPDGDYAYRLFVSKRRWALIVREMVQEVDWDNFRKAADAYQGAAGRHYIEAIHDVWDRMAHL